MSTLEGCLIEPLSVGFYAANQGEVGTGDVAVLLGAGCIGLVPPPACTASGCPAGRPEALAFFSSPFVNLQHLRR